MSAEAAKKDFFISYNSADEDRAVWIAAQLESAGYSTIIQAWDFRPGHNFVVQMQNAAMNAERTIGVLSPGYFSSGFAMSEFAAAFSQDPMGVMRKFIPVRVRSCEVEGLLRPIIYIDLVGLDEARALEALLEGVKRDPDVARVTGQRPKWPRVSQGTLPAIWNVPYRRNPNFTGRGNLLADLRTTLTSGIPAALTQAMHGLGGVGKTQLALEYAYRHKCDYDIVWWVRSEDSSTLASDYASLAERLDLAVDDPSNQPEIVKAVRCHLGRIGGWLLIFDNAPTPDDVKPYLPQGENGHMVITSRESDWSGMASSLEVRVWSRTESVAFLLRRTGSDDGNAADRLAEALGDFPLALEQAGAYVRKASKSLADYTKLYQKHRQDLLELGKPATDYEATVATTWEISFQALREHSRAGADLLNLCAFFAPDDIPLDMIRTGAEFLPEPLSGVVQDELRFDEAVMALAHYSLLDSTDGMLSIHRLVQAATRHRLDGNSQRKWAETAIHLMDYAFPRDSWDVLTWEHCDSLLPHSLTSADFGEALHIVPCETGRILNEAGLYLRGRAELGEARKLFDRAIRIGQATLGRNHAEVAVWMSNLGNVLQAAGDYQGARKQYENALAIAESASVPDQLKVAVFANNLGSLLAELGDSRGAKVHLERALGIYETLFGCSDPNVAISLVNIGDMLRDTGDLRGARRCFEAALAIDEAAYGSDHPEVAVDLSQLGITLRGLGELDLAKRHLERALQIGEATLGLKHPEVAPWISNLGGVLRALGDLHGAKAQFELALTSVQDALGPEHPNVAICLNNIASLLQEQNDLYGARKSYERALEICRRSLGDDHPRTTLIRLSLEAIRREMKIKRPY